MWRSQTQTMPYGKDFIIFGHHYGDYLALTWRLMQNISWEKRMAFRQTYIITYGNVRSHGIPLIFAWPIYLHSKAGIYIVSKISPVS